MVRSVICTLDEAEAVVITGSCMSHSSLSGACIEEAKAARTRREWSLDIWLSVMITRLRSERILMRESLFSTRNNDRENTHSRQAWKNMKKESWEIVPRTVRISAAYNDIRNCKDKRKPDITQGTMGSDNSDVNEVVWAFVLLMAYSKYIMTATAFVMQSDAKATRPV